LKFQPILPLAQAYGWGEDIAFEEVENRVIHEIFCIREMTGLAQCTIISTDGNMDCNLKAGIDLLFYPMPQ
jgi:hypothetical protein